MNITQELNNIIFKYNWDRHYPEYHKWVNDGDESHLDFLEKRHVEYRGVDTLSDGDEGRIEYVEYYYLKKELESCSLEDAPTVYEKLFFISLFMKNFVRAGEWYEKLHKYPEDEWECGWNEILSLLSDIKEKLAVNKHKHIVLYWIDSTDYGESLEMPYIQSRREHSVHFREFYTVTPFTHPTLKTMFCGLHPTDDGGHAVESINEANSEIFRFMKLKGYSMCCISGHMKRYFQDADIVNEDILRGKEPCSGAFWKMLGHMLSDETDTLYLAHAMVETHPPAFSTYIDGIDGASTLTRAVFGQREIDRQIEFYDALIGDGPYRIYMSDHGLTRLTKRWHVHMQFYHKTWQPKDVGGMVSMLDFSRFVEQMIEDGYVYPEQYIREYVPISDFTKYNKRMIENLIRERRVEFEYTIGYRGVIGKDYVYIRYETGYEWLMNKTSENSTLFLQGETSDSYNPAVLAKYRKAAGDFPKGYLTGEKFKYTKYVHMLYDNVKNTISHINQVLEQKLLYYEDKSIAFRMGGYHTIALYGTLSTDIRRKFGVIIDINKECDAAGIGLPVISTQEQMPAGIKAILLSTRIHLGALKKEAKEKYAEYEIIDIYDILEKEGIRCTQEFYMGTESDYKSVEDSMKKEETVS